MSDTDSKVAQMGEPTAIPFGFEAIDPDGGSGQWRRTRHFQPAESTTAATCSGSWHVYPSITGPCRECGAYALIESSGVRYFCGRHSLTLEDISGRCDQRGECPACTKWVEPDHWRVLFVTGSSSRVTGELEVDTFRRDPTVVAIEKFESGSCVSRERVTLLASPPCLSLEAQAPGSRPSESGAAFSAEQCAAVAEGRS